MARLNAVSSAASLLAIAGTIGGVLWFVTKPELKSEMSVN